MSVYGCYRENTPFGGNEADSCPGKPLYLNVLASGGEFVTGRSEIELRKAVRTKENIQKSQNNNLYSVKNR